MTRESDFIAQLEDYLDEYEGSTPAPDEVRAVIRAGLPSIQQRPAAWPTRRLSPMNNTLKFAVAAAVVAMAALLGFNYLVAPNVGGPGLGDPSPTPHPTPTPVAALAGQEDLAAGRYSIESGISMRVTAAVPNGWSSIDSWE